MTDRNSQGVSRGYGRSWIVRAAATGTILSLGVAIGMASLADPNGLPARPVNGELGLVLTAFAPAIYQGKDDCPQGLAGTVRENYLQTLPQAERARLLQPANEKELSEKWKAYAVGPNNTNICNNPELFQRPMMPTVQGKIAPGLDLDGGSSKATCSHQSFTSPEGWQGVDNESYRAMGCTRNYRGVDGKAGDVVRGFNGQLLTGEHTMVLLIRGIDSFQKDDDVEVIFASSDDRPIVDSKMNFITGASFTVNPKWRTAMHGRIENGVLTTDAADVRLKRPWGHGGIRGAETEWDLRQGRFRLEFATDGSVKGLFGAYQPPENIIRSTLIGGIGAATTAGIDCAAQLTTLKKLADGIPDPKTGECTALSTALDVAAVPAFINDAPPGLAAKGGGR